MKENDVVKIAKLVNRRDRYMKTLSELSTFIYSDTKNYTQADSITIQSDAIGYGIVVKIDEEEFDMMNELVIKMAGVYRNHIRDLDEELFKL